jgi:hypothetical protein
MLQVRQELAGYFSSADAVPPEVRRYSNAVEMFLFNSQTVELGEPFAYNVLAHEFQHMIHWSRDRNEENWMNEGFSELAALLNGFYSSGFDGAYIVDPDVQLTTGLIRMVMARIMALLSFSFFPTASVKRPQKPGWKPC